MNLRIVTLSKSCDKNDFSCGSKQLDNYLLRQANQDVKRKLSACFVLINQNSKVLAFYTLSSASVPKESIPKNISKSFPSNYTNLPVTLLGRLAVDKIQKAMALVNCY